MNRDMRGMSRRGFMRAVGAGAAGMAGAAMFGSGVVSAAGIQNSNWKVGIIVRNTSLASNYQSLQQMELVLDSAGIDHTYLNLAESPYSGWPQFKQGYEAAKKLVGTEGCNALLGIALSAQSAGITGYTAEVPVPYVECYGTADGNNKRYFHRTTTTSSAWGEISASLISTSPERVYGYSKPGDSFAIDAYVGWGKTFPDTELLEVRLVTSVPLPDPLPYIYDGYYYTQFGTQFFRVQELPESTGNYAVTVPVGTDNEVKAVFEYLNNLTNPPSQVALIGSHSGKDWVDDYENLNLVAVQPHYDITSQGFKAWRAFTGLGEGDILWDKTLRAFDAAMLLAAGLVGTNSPNEAHFTINAFSSPLGSPLYPDEINKLMRGNSSVDLINYEGASGPCDMVLGECLTMPFVHYAGLDYNKVIWQ